MPGIFVSAAVIVQAGIVLSTLFWAKKKNRGDMQPVIIGAVTFYVFVLLLENILNYALVLLIPNWKAKISGNVVSYVLYGCSMAALFEENGRYYSFTRVIKTYKEPEAALGYGAGHGGLEMVLSGILALMLLRPEAFAAVDSSLWVIERTAALAGHIALSVIVFYGVQRARKRYLLIAIALHGIADIPIGLYKYGAISLIACDALFATAVFLCGITAFWCYAHLSMEKDPIDDRKGQHGNGPPKNRIFSRQN